MLFSFIFIIFSHENNFFVLILKKPAELKNQKLF